MFLILGGCFRNIATLDEYTQHWIGRPIAEMKENVSRPESYASRIGWEETTYKLANGNWVYVEPDSKNCFIHWEVNTRGIIIGYRLEGNGCIGQ